MYSEEEVHIIEIPNQEKPLKIILKEYSELESACKNCPNYPSNGGSGICHCILGQQQITC